MQLNQQVGEGTEGGRVEQSPHRPSERSLPFLGCLDFDGNQRLLDDFRPQDVCFALFVPLL